MLSSQPFFNRLYQLIDGEWTDWQERRAWLPQRLPTDDGYRWIWLRKYWSRQRRTHNFIDNHGNGVYECDFAFDLFDIIRKS